MVSGFFVALFCIVDPSKIRRRDGTPLAHYPHQGIWQELKNQRQLLQDWRLLVMFIPMIASEVAIIVLSSLNSLYFNIRTRSLNSLMFNVFQVVGAIFIGFMLDNSKISSRRARGFISVAVVATIVIAGWIGLTVWLYKNPMDLLNPPLFDWTDGPFGGFFVLNLIFGINMVIYQVTVQWIISSFTNDPEKLARLAGLVKGVLAGGLAAAFGTEAAGIPQLHVVAYTFTVQAVGLVLMAAVTWKCVTPTNYMKEENVIAPKAMLTEEKEVERADAHRLPTLDFDTHTQNRIRLAHLLQEAHAAQKYNTRRVEESYHALRTSTRRLERLWSSYCEELERELGVDNWKDIARLSASKGVFDKDRPDADDYQVGGDRFPDLPSPDSTPDPLTRDPLTREPPTLRTRPQSNNLQASQRQFQPPIPIIQEPQVSASTHNLPSRYNTAPSSRRKPKPYEVQAPPPGSSLQITMPMIPKRHASLPPLPTREYLVALSNSPASTHPEPRTSQNAARPDARESPQPIPNLRNADFHGNTNYGNANHNSANHRSAGQNPNQPYTVEDFRNPMTHEALTYGPSVEGHWGSPTNGGNNAKTADHGLIRKHGSVGRARLQKKRLG
ncbi:MAG: hypothetical protein Q9169_008198 [Polycauliona sp. 2 TL-2023]